MVNSELKKKEKGFGGKWVWVVIPLIAAIVAISISSRTSSKISLFGVIGKACQCAMGTPKYSGMVEDCCCDYETVDNLNEEVLYPSLQELVKTPFFRYFKAKLWCDCPFWPDDGMCRLRDCSVCECPDNEFPEQKEHRSFELNITMSLSMSTTTSGHYTALSLPTRTTQINSKQNPTYFFPNTKLFSSKNHSFSNTLLSKPFLYVVKASSEVGSDASKEDSEKGEGEKEPYEEYEVEIDQPYGIKFVKGRDGGTYIDAIAPGGSADKAGVFTVGDKVLATSAVFGTEIWPAAEYGRTMYTIRQRIGPLLMRMQKRYGKIETGGDLTEKEIIRAERNSGVVSNKLREIQMQNYLRKKEVKEGRERDLREGLLLYRNAKYEEALEKFESVLGSKPEPDEAAVASYNVACCYSKLNQIQAALSTLEEALNSGFEDFKRIRTDPDLANLRASPEFDPLLKRFDESFINESAINAIKSIFGFNKK